MYQKNPISTTMHQKYLYYAEEQTEFYTAEGCYITELFNTQEHPGASIAQARLVPGKATENHSLRDTTEWYYILRGSGEVFLDNEAVGRVQTGDVVHIPAGLPQYIHNTGAEDLVFLCVCAPGFRQEVYVGMTNERMNE
jgi:oxalate decarboxylase/phosphoglucose isomerase-like protein (cupin superfamily)